MKIKKVILGVTLLAGILLTVNSVKQNGGHKSTEAKLGLCAGYALAQAFEASDEASELAADVGAMAGTAYYGALGMEWGASIGWLGGPGGAAVGAVCGGL